MANQISKKPTLTFLIASILSVLIACSKSEYKDTVSAPVASSEIIGGVPVSSQDSIAASTVVLYLASKNPFSGEITLKNFCTGTLIAADIVLSAAHCLVDFSEMVGMDLQTLLEHIVVGFGVNVQSTVTDQNKFLLRTLANAIVHKDYEANSAGRENVKPMQDISLLKLRKPAPARATPVNIVSNESLLKKGMNLTLAGFGLIQSGDVTVLAKKLRKVDVTVDDPSMSETQFSYLNVNGKTACSGDSGGPAYVKNSDGSYSVIGITSWGDKDCKEIGVYTSVPHFSEWIQSAMSSL